MRKHAVANPFESRRRAMVRDQLISRGIQDPRVLNAFGRVERHCYIPANHREQAYADHPVAIGCEQTISQPYIVAYILAELGLRGRERILEIGTGSGYQTALLAELAAEIYTVEYFPALAERALKALTAAGYNDVRLRIGNGRAGWPEAAPFDAIVCSAAPTAIPTRLADQLAAGGRLILPLGEEQQQLVAVWRERDGYHQRQLMPVRFVPMQ